MLRNCPGLTREQILAFVAYARDRLSEEGVSVSGTFALTTPRPPASVLP